MKLQFQAPALGALTAGRRGAPFLPPNNLSVSNLGSNSRSYPTQTTIEPILPALWLAPPPHSRSLSHNPNTIEFA